MASFNTQRLLEPIGYVPPAEYEEQFHRTQATQLVEWGSYEACMNFLEQNLEPYECIIAERQLTTGMTFAQVQASPPLDRLVDSFPPGN